MITAMTSHRKPTCSPPVSYTHLDVYKRQAVYNVKHGAGLAVIVPAWITFRAEHNPKKIARFANRVCGVPENEDLEEMALAGISRLKHFFR